MERIIFLLCSFLLVSCTMSFDGKVEGEIESDMSVQCKNHSYSNSSSTMTTVSTIETENGTKVIRTRRSHSSSTENNRGLEWEIESDVEFEGEIQNHP